MKQLILKYLNITEAYIDVVLVILSLVMGIYLNWEMASIVMFSSILWFILKSWSSSKIAKLTALSLFLSAICLVAKKNYYAEVFSIYAFYLLGLTLFVAIFEFTPEKGDDE